MYKIIGSDKREYGPVGVETINQWIKEGRANGESQVRAEGGLSWQPLRAFPELAALLGGPPPVAPPAFVAVPVAEYSCQKNNSFAVAGFIVSLLGIPCCCCCGIFPLVGLILSLIGFAQIMMNRNQRGLGFAIAGIVISAVLLFGSLLGALVGKIH